MQWIYEVLKNMPHVSSSAAYIVRDKCVCVCVCLPLFWGRSELKPPFGEIKKIGKNK